MTIKYIIGHWTAGNYTPSDFDKSHYQLLIDNNGKVYAGGLIGQCSSTGGMNSITYNIACCGGLPASPMTKKQIESLCHNVAVKLKVYGLKVNDFYTHAEIGEMTRNYLNKYKGKKITEILIWNEYLKQNVGKIDLRDLPETTGKIRYDIPAFESGNILRKKIRWYYERLERNEA